MLDFDSIKSKARIGDRWPFYHIGVNDCLGVYETEGRTPTQIQRMVHAHAVYTGKKFITKTGIDGVLYVKRIA